jgi:uncharacterized membrane protein
MAIPARRRNALISLNRAIYWSARHWLGLFILLTGIWVALPWLAPVLMHWGLETPARWIYFIYSFQCHQLPQRSYFLFGPQPSLSLEFIQQAWQNTNDPSVLRQFIGSPELGWKVAWSDRMVSAYGMIPVAAALWGLLRKRIRPMSLRTFFLLSLPMAVDGGTHMLSDLAGIGQGFRYTNQWLAILTANRFPASFYAGTTLGSFNSIMRLITGTLFAFGVVGFAMPYLEEAFRDMARTIEDKFKRAGVDA